MNFSIQFFGLSKTLEQLQTDSHKEVSSHYGLERSKHHSKKYLPLLQFKAQQAKNKIATFTNDLDTAAINQQHFDQLKKSAHYSSSGILFKTENKENVELPTVSFLALCDMAQQGVKSVAHLNFLNEQITELKHREFQAKSDSDYYLHELNKLDKSTATYTDIPKGWRKYIDGSISEWKKTFTSYCHDLNRAIVRVYISTGDIEKTDKLLRPLLKSIGISNVGRHIDNIISSAKLQHKNHTQPQRLTYSWIPPKPASTDYNHADESGIVPLQLKNTSDINWDMINWDLLSELDKDELRNKKILREL